MKRGLAVAITALIGFGTLFVMQSTPAGAVVAQESCFPGTDPDYPPTGNNGTVEPLGLVNGQFNPGGNGSFTIDDAVAGDTYCGFIFSTPITLLPKVANAQGQVAWAFAVPADFQLNAVHHADIYKGQAKVGAFDFCVGSSGSIVALSACQGTSGSTSSTTPTTAGGGSNTTTNVQGTNSTRATTPAGKLPRTGSDVLEFLQAAVLAIGAGVGLLYARRRRSARFTV